MRAKMAFELFVQLPIEGSILDIGSSDLQHTKHLRDMGFNVITVDPHYKSDIQEHWPCIMGMVENIWCSHVLEHSRNPGLFLDAIYETLIEDGWLAITVPPWKDEIVGGHVTIWNAGILIYNLILSGFDCSKAKVKTHGNDVSLIMRKKSIELPELVDDSGDIDKISQFFPVRAYQGFNGHIEEVNWIL